MKNRTVPPLSVDQTERFWSKIFKTDKCWEWKGGLTGGYGRFYTKKGEAFLAHRISYQLAKGHLSETLVLDHLCRNPRCVNPDHLEEVTSGENVLRGAGPGARCAKATHCKNGHEFDRVWQGGRRYCSVCHANRCKTWREKAIQA